MNKTFDKTWMLDQVVSQNKATGVGLLDFLLCFKPLLWLPSVLCFLLGDSLCRESSFLSSLWNSATILNRPAHVPFTTESVCMRCEIREMTTLEWEKLTYFDDFWGVVTAGDNKWVAWQSTAVLCYVRGEVVVPFQRLFLSFPPSYADLSDENIPRLIKVRANLWTCSSPLVLYALKEKSKSRVRCIGYCWTMEKVSGGQYLSWLTYLFLILAVWGPWSLWSEGCCRAWSCS